MRVGVVFSQADGGTDPDAIRDSARTAEAAVTVKAEVDGIVG